MDHYSIVEPPLPDKDRGTGPEDQAAPAGESLAAPAVASEAAAPPETPLPEASPVLAPAAAQEAGVDVNAALQTLAQKAQYISNATGAAIALRQGADVVCRAACGNSAPDRGARLQIKTGLTAECLRSGELLRCDNVMLDARVDLESCKRLGIESIIITPIHRGSELAGVLELFSAHAYSFQERDVETVKALAREIGKLLEEEREESAPVPEPPGLPPPVVENAPAHRGNTCLGCGAEIASDAVFCNACGSFQEDKPAGTGERVLGWKARLSSRRLLVPAVFVMMALVVAVAPIPRRPGAAAAGTQPVLSAATAPPASPRASARAPAGTTPAAPQPAAKGGAPGAANNPTIANSVKQLLGGVSSDFSKLLPVNEKAEPPSNGDPHLRVWVDTRKGYYYCPGDAQYGRTEHGSYMTQKEAESNYYIPALIKPCM